jgi:hypothetical protein
MPIINGTIERIWQAIQQRDARSLTAEINHIHAGMLCVCPDCQLRQRLRDERERPPRPSYEIEADAYSQPWSGPL